MRLPKGLSLIHHEGKTLVQLYNTLIAVIDKTGPAPLFRLNSGGWQTKHTKKCLNLVLNEYGVYVYQKNFNWYINTPIHQNMEFTDGIEFTN